MDFMEFEKELQEHGKRVKNAVAPPFFITDLLDQIDEENSRESEEKIVKIETVKQTTRKSMKTMVLAAALVCAVSASAFAAYQYLTAGEAAEQLGDKKLAAQLAGSSFSPQTLSDGVYQATVLGVTTGENISDFQPDTWDVAPGNTYAVVAIQKTDGAAMTWDDEILVTPLIQGLQPWQYNIFTMHHGGYQAQIIDGVLYRILEFDDIQFFADKEVYLAVLGQPFLDNTSYAMDEKTGVITPKADYDGTNLLFKLPLDPAKADPEKAEQYLKAIDEEMHGDGDTDTVGGSDDVTPEVGEMTDIEIEDGEAVIINADENNTDNIVVRRKGYK